MLQLSQPSKMLEANPRNARNFVFGEELLTRRDVGQFFDSSRLLVLSHRKITKILEHVACQSLALAVEDQSHLPRPSQTMIYRTKSKRRADVEVWNLHRGGGNVLPILRMCLQFLVQERPKNFHQRLARKREPIAGCALP
jgi:hypothetical protein